MSSEELHHSRIPLNPSITKGLKYEILMATGKSGAPSEHPQSSMHLTPLNSEEFLKSSPALTEVWGSYLQHFFGTWASWEPRRTKIAAAYSSGKSGTYVPANKHRRGHCCLHLVNKIFFFLCAENSVLLAHLLPPHYIGTQHFTWRHRRPPTLPHKLPDCPLRFWNPKNSSTAALQTGTAGLRRRWQNPIPVVPRQESEQAAFVWKPSAAEGYWLRVLSGAQ